MLTLEERQIRWLRLRASGLTGPGIGGDVPEVVGRVCGLQAQDRGAVELAVQPRSRRARDGSVRQPALRRGDVAEALDESRSVARIWAMRATIHMLAAEDVGWLLALLGPVFVEKGGRRRRELGLDEAICAQATAAMERILGKSGPLTRRELLERLAAEGIPVEGQAGYHLIARAGLEGVVCFGPDRDGEHTFVLVEDWLGGYWPALEGEEALAELLRRYLAAFGPAGAHDFASWSGLGVREARRALAMNEGALAAARVKESGGEMVLLAEQEGWIGERPDGGEPSARLLPAYDSFLLGHADRDLLVTDRYARKVHPGGGIIRPTVLVDGRAVGNWRLKRKGKRMKVELELWRDLSQEVQAAVAQEVSALRAYLDA